MVDSHLLDLEKDIGIVYDSRVDYLLEQTEGVLNKEILTQAMFTYPGGIKKKDVETKLLNKNSNIVFHTSESTKEFIECCWVANSTQNRPTMAVNTKLLQNNL